METIFYSFFLFFNIFCTFPFIPEKLSLSIYIYKKNHCFFWNKSLKSFLFKTHLPFVQHYLNILLVFCKWITPENIHSMCIPAARISYSCCRTSMMLRMEEATCGNEEATKWVSRCLCPDSIVGSTKGTSNGFLTSLEHTGTGRWDHTTSTLMDFRTKPWWPWQDPLGHRWLHALSQLHAGHQIRAGGSGVGLHRAGQAPSARSSPFPLPWDTFYIAQSRRLDSFLSVSHLPAQGALAPVLTWPHFWLKRSHGKNPKPGHLSLGKRPSNRFHYFHHV